MEQAGAHLTSEEKNALLSGGPSIGMSFASDSADPDVWREYLASDACRKSTALTRSGGANVAALAEALFEKVPLMGMGFGSAH